MPTVEKWVLMSFRELSKHVEQQMLDRGIEAAQVTKEDDDQWRALVRVTRRVPAGERTATGVSLGVTPLGAIFEAWTQAEKMHADLAAHERKKKESRKPVGVEAAS